MIENVARAIWTEQRNHWGRYRDMVPDLCEWEELTQSKQRELLREAKAAIAAMQQAQQWQGIESAPRDGTLILVPVGHGVMDVVSWWGGAWRETANALAIRDEPTHWMPLPTPPAGGSDAE